MSRLSTFLCVLVFPAIAISQEFFLRGMIGGSVVGSRRQLHQAFEEHDLDIRSPGSCFLGCTGSQDRPHTDFIPSYYAEVGLKLALYNLGIKIGSSNSGETFGLGIYNNPDHNDALPLEVVLDYKTSYVLPFIEYGISDSFWIQAGVGLFIINHQREEREFYETNLIDYKERRIGFNLGSRLIILNGDKLRWSLIGEYRLAGKTDIGPYGFNFNGSGPLIDQLPKTTISFNHLDVGINIEFGI